MAGVELDAITMLLLGGDERMRALAPWGGEDYGGKQGETSECVGCGKHISVPGTPEMRDSVDSSSLKNIVGGEDWAIHEHIVALGSRRLVSSPRGAMVSMVIHRRGRATTWRTQMVDTAGLVRVMEELTNAARTVRTAITAIRLRSTGNHDGNEGVAIHSMYLPYVTLIKGIP